VKEPRIRYRPGRDPKPESRTDWDRLKRMSDEQIERAALDDPDAQPLSDEQLARGFISQAEFARQFMLNLRTLQDWEQCAGSLKILPECICA
jgi:putative transcriptional regulator